MLPQTRQCQNRTKSLMTTMRRTSRLMPRTTPISKKIRHGSAQKACAMVIWGIIA